MLAYNFYKLIIKRSMMNSFNFIFYINTKNLIAMIYINM